jgi:hypothetical protein
MPRTVDSSETSQANQVRSEYRGVITIRRPILIRKAFVTGAIAVVIGVGAAAPALADPPTFNEISCSCQPPVPLFRPPAPDPITQGIQQGLSDLDPNAVQR